MVAGSTLAFMAKSRLFLFNRRCKTEGKAHSWKWFLVFLRASGELLERNKVSFAQISHAWVPVMNEWGHSTVLLKLKARSNRRCGGCCYVPLGSWPFQKIATVTPLCLYLQPKMSKIMTHSAIPHICFHFFSKLILWSCPFSFIRMVNYLIMLAGHLLISIKISCILKFIDKNYFGQKRHFTQRKWSFVKSTFHWQRRSFYWSKIIWAQSVNKFAFIVNMRVQTK